MKDFFTFYTDIRNMAVPFTAFSLYHMLFLALAILLITTLFSYYRRLDAGKQRRMLCQKASESKRIPELLRCLLLPLAKILVILLSSIFKQAPANHWAACYLRPATHRNPKR